MEKDLYRIMKEILDAKKTNHTKDIQYIGTIQTSEETNNISTKISKDIFIIIDQMPDGSIIQKFYDENNNFIAFRNQEGKIYPAEQNLEKNKNIVGKIEELQNKPGISLNDLNKQLEIIAKEIGTKKERILAMSVIDLKQEIEEKGKKEANKSITLDNDKTKEIKEQKEEEKAKNKNTLEKISSKQEIDLNKKIDDKYTLGDIFGIESGAKLIAVYSDAIQNNKNTTRFSFIIQKSDGTLQEADMLNQIGGKESDKNVYEINNDGSEVTKKSVQSSYSINSPIVKNGIITAKIGSMGYIEIGYGELDKTSNKDALTHELETSRTYSTKNNVREEFSGKKGTDNIKEDIREIKEHEKYDCKHATLEDADGDKETSSHKHLENEEGSEYKTNIIEEIKQYDENIEEVFTDQEIQARLESISQKDPKLSFDEIVERTKQNLSEDASHMKIR